MLSNGRAIRRIVRRSSRKFASCMNRTSRFLRFVSDTSRLMALATGADTHKIEIRTPRGQSSGEGSCDRTRLYFLTESRLCGRYNDFWTTNVAKPALFNVNDGTNEGLAYVGKNIFTVQFFIARTYPGPQDYAYYSTVLCHDVIGVRCLDDEKEENRRLCQEIKKSKKCSHWLRSDHYRTGGRGLIMRECRRAAR